jgi:uncharacterized protein YuzE
VVSVISRIPGIVRIGGIGFDNVTYDVDGDVLYLWCGQPRRPAYDDASSEGHYIQFGDDGAVIAITVVNARWILEQEGKITVTLPERRLEATDLGAVLSAA